MRWNYEWTAIDGEADIVHLLCNHKTIRIQIVKGYTIRNTAFSVPLKRPSGEKNVEMVKQTTAKFFIVDLLCREHKEITVILFLDIFPYLKTDYMVVAMTSALAVIKRGFFFNCALLLSPHSDCQAIHTVLMEHNSKKKKSHLNERAKNNGQLSSSFYQPPPFINGSFRCHVCPPEQRAGEEKNDVQEATVRVPVEIKRLPVATIPTDAEDWISEWGAVLWGSHLDGKAGCLLPKMAVLAWGTFASLPHH